MVPKGGRGKKADYRTIQVRCPEPIKDAVHQLIRQYHHQGEQPLQTDVAEECQLPERTGQAPYHTRTNPPKKGDRICSAYGKTGRITNVKSSNPRYEITWDNGHYSWYDFKDLEDLDIRKFVPPLAPAKPPAELSGAELLAMMAALAAEYSCRIPKSTEKQAEEICDHIIAEMDKAEIGHNERLQVVAALTERFFN